MMDGVAEVDTDVTSSPSVVNMNVMSVGEGDTVGMAVALTWCESSAGEYVLVARPDRTISPARAGTEVLNAYGGVEGDGVGRR